MLREKIITIINIILIIFTLGATSILIYGFIKWKFWLNQFDEIYTKISLGQFDTFDTHDNPELKKAKKKSSYYRTFLIIGLAVLATCLIIYLLTNF